MKEKGVFPVPETEVLRATAVVRAVRKNGLSIKKKSPSSAFRRADTLRRAWACIGAGNRFCARRAYQPTEAKPNALVLIYPCITAEKYSYPGIKAVHGRGLPEAETELLNVHRYVGPHTPPAYLCHTSEDTCVPVMNTLLFASALAEHNIPFETRIFKNGPHGMSLATAAVRPDPAKMSEEARALIKNPKVLAHLKKSTAAFSVWMQESVAFLSDIFSL